MADALHTQVDKIRRSLKADGHCCRGNRTGAEWFTQQPCWGNDAPASQATNYRSSGTGFRLARPRNAIRMELANTGVAVSVNMSTTQSTSLSLAGNHGSRQNSQHPVILTPSQPALPITQPASPWVNHPALLPPNPSLFPIRHPAIMTPSPPTHKPTSPTTHQFPCPLGTPAPNPPIHIPASPTDPSTASPAKYPIPSPPNRQSASPTKPPIPQPPEPSIRQP